MKNEEKKSNETETGSGVTFVRIVREVIEKSAKDYEAELSAFVARKALTKKRAEDMAAGFRDGMRTMLVHLEGLGVIVIAEEGLTGSEIETVKKYVSDTVKR